MGASRTLRSDLYATNIGGKTALDIATKMGYMEVSKLLKVKKVDETPAQTHVCVY